MNSVFSMIGEMFGNVWRFLKGVGTKRRWVAVVVAIVIIGGIGFVTFGPQSGTDDETVPDDRRAVELISVVDFAEGSESSTSGAGSETVVRAETAGKITQVVPVGSRASAGTTIALFENAAQQAALLQAEGALEAAEASLEKTQGGPRSERIAVLETAVESAENSTVATLLSAYAAVDSAIRNSADEMFSNSETNAPRLNFVSSNAQRISQLENNRVLMSVILDRQSSISTALSTNSDLEVELNATESEVRDALAFIDTLIAAINEAIPTGSITSSDIAGYKTSVSSARTTLTTSLSSIASARGSLETAEKNLEEGLVGAEDADLAAAAAAVKQAQGSYDAALAAYRKTIVRTDVSGTIVSCSAEVGDVVSVGSDICRVKTVSAAPGSAFILPLASVKYTPAGAFVFIVNQDGSLEVIEVETGLVTAGGITVTGLLGDEFIVRDVRGLKAGELVNIK